MNQFAVVLLLLASSLSSLPASAQAALQHRASAPADYVLGSGDQILLHVSDVDEISDKPIQIDPSGFVDIPLAGRVQASGLTLAGLKAELSARLSKYIKNPQVSVNLTTSGSQPVSVLGQVNNPGVHQLDGSKRLIEVISLSGGLRPDAGDEVIVTREARWGRINLPHGSVDPETGSSTASLSLDSLMTSRRPAENILIEPDDIISIPKAGLVYVVGDVRKAGGFQLTTHESVSLLQVLSLAEGLMPDNAAGRARILRPLPGGDGVPREIPVDVPKIFAGKAPDVKLYANDVLFIPHSGVKATSRRALEAAIGITSGLLIYR